MKPVTASYTLNDAQPRTVVLRRQSDIAIIEIDHPPVNAMSAHVRRQLLDALQEAEADASVAGIVLTGRGGRFVAGADIREFGKPPVAPTLPDVVEALGRCSKPIAAGIEGQALGGGLELALACDWRIATAGSVLGFPEVKLGLIPGAGGTQRLPRLVGVARSIELIATGRIIKIPEALEIGLIDEVLQGSTVDACILQLQKRRGMKRPVSSLPIVSDQAGIDEARAAVLKNRRIATEAARTAVDVVASAMHLGFDEGLAAERSAFAKLRGGEEAAALRYLFFAEREAPRVAGLDASPLPVGKAGVVGAGTMGSGIAVALINAGFSVVLVEQSTEALEKGISRIDEILSRAVKSGRASAETAESQRKQLIPTTSMTMLGDVDLVIEAAFEVLEVKLDLFRRLDQIVSPQAVLATNTSYLDIDAIAAATTNPGRVLGLHFFSPAHVMRLLEIARGRETSDEALATGLALARKLGKLPVVAGVCDGFIGNRIFSAYRRQCEIMLEEGALPEEIDKALETFGFAMGPFAVADLAGLDISWSRRKRLASSRDPRERYVPIADMLCEQGRFGQKTSMGWYRYSGTEKRREPDPVVRALIEQASAARGIERRSIDADEIQRRVLAAMVNEAVLVIEERIAQRASDIDVVLVHGYGFPPARGGPLFWASRQNAASLNQALDAVEASTGFGFRRAQTIPQVLAEVAS
ncbi:3-hydroxyacyl-CoA dehydrogenase NAD-binding domain-containing protein [Microvirga guangxiensis]|uniref:3-hydroxyacyl-CoA dehydrogenase n=1 Tax=Microvirga guangxiensis TaxID=549386 RepID=A0A1G5F1B9_9HYPH|nr:3-hydroxyacyl-CoA dehydrogenase NAD-binding domain-containing protein [Microvirga guangxiensis]SCY32954.1 3-hydroxyacyl-CoA dehydrogenase [Microvirga guangxiensis]